MLCGFATKLAALRPNAGWSLALAGGPCPPHEGLSTQWEEALSTGAPSDNLQRLFDGCVVIINNVTRKSDEPAEERRCQSAK